MHYLLSRCFLVTCLSSLLLTGHFCNCLSSSTYIFAMFRPLPLDNATGDLQRMILVRLDALDCKSCFVSSIWFICIVLSCVYNLVYNCAFDSLICKYLSRLLFNLVCVADWFLHKPDFNFSCICYISCSSFYFSLSSFWSCFLVLFISFTSSV